MDEPKRLDDAMQTSLASPLTPESRTPTAERRQISVLFCNLLARSVDSQRIPAALHEMIQAYHDICAAVVQRFEGYIARNLADGLLAYFGYPMAHEDNARRAVSAGLEIMQTLQQRFRLVSHRGEELTVRLGIYAERAIIGGMHAADQRQHIALSMAPNLAVRLGGLAFPNAVLICATTYQQVQSFFLCEAVDSRLLQEFRSPLAAYRVLRENTAHSVFEARATMGLTPLVGRQEEVCQLLERWESAKNGLGQVVVLNGEAGIGKSRLMQVIKESLADEAHIMLEYRGSPHHRHSALHPVIDLWQRILRFQKGASPEEKLDKLETALSPYRCAMEEAVPLFASLLSLPLPADRYPPLALTPQRQKQKTLALLVAMLVEMAAQQPVWLVVEDLHLVDPSTLEFLSLLLDTVPTIPLLALFTHRPEFRVPWTPREHVTQLTIGRLSPQQVEQMLTLLVGGKALPTAIRQQLLTQTDGVPLFVEECTKMVLESGFLQERQSQYKLTGPLPSLAIPTTLQDSLMARLDRLSTAKTVAQRAATLGRSFSYALLQAVSRLDEATLQQALERLVEAELLYQQGLPPHSTYMFKHALIQEVAYQSLITHTRQQYHQGIAEVLVERFPEMVTMQPELVAHHYTEAGCSAQAIAYWQRAGARASARSACAEAIVHLNKGLQLLAALPDTPEHVQQELDMQTILGPAFMAVKSPVAPEAEQAYARARALCQRVGTTPKLVWALEGLWAFYLVRGRLHTARELGEQLLSLAQRLQTPVSFAVAHQSLGLTLFYLGEFALALAHFEKGVAHYALQLQHTDRLCVCDPGVMCHAFAALALCMQGYPDQALLRIQTVLARLEKIRQF